MRIDKNKYYNIHLWIKRKYGRATHCEFCSNPMKRFEWALRKGFKYDYNINNFIQLCRSCHINYDMNDEWKRNISNAKKGNTNLLNFVFTEKSKYKMSIAHLGKKLSDETKMKMSNVAKGKRKSKLHAQHIKESWVLRKLNQMKCE
jgi:hypothetical protein